MAKVNDELKDYFPNKLNMDVVREADRADYLAGFWNLRGNSKRAAYYTGKAVGMRVVIAAHRSEVAF